MITLTRAQARLFRTVLRKSAPSGSGRSFAPPFSLHATEDGLLIQAHHAEVALAWRLPGPRPPDTITLPSKALDDFEGAKDTVVELSLKGADTIQAKWHDGVMPQSREYDTAGSDKLPPFPVEPAKFLSQNLKLLKALEDATQTAAKEPVSFAQMRLQLRGVKGEIVSTDGRQLLLQRGFKFPWREDVLVPAIGMFGCKELSQEDSVSIGRTANHVCLRIGAWRFHLTIDKDARYPRVEHAIPADFAKGTALRASPEDGSFIVQSLPRLPGRGELYEPVTVDLNGRVAIRARDGVDNPSTELPLSRSEVIGPPLRFVCNRQYLARAVRLGFADFFIKNPDIPIVCRDPQRLYVFVPLSKDAAISASKDAIRIESAVTPNVVAPETSTPRRIKAMPAPPSNGHPTNGSPDPNGRSENGTNFADLLAEAEELRTVVLDASARLARLISGLKQHRRHSRAVQDAVRSLKQLKLDA